MARAYGSQVLSVRVPAALLAKVDAVGSAKWPWRGRGVRTFAVIQALREYVARAEAPAVPDGSATQSRAHVGTRGRCLKQ